MDDRARVLEKLKEKASSEEEGNRLASLLQTAYEGLEQGLSSGVEKQVRERLQTLMEKLDKAAQAVKEKMG